ncbi:hypothetical protein ACTZWT_15570 [Rhodopseudomonas sp. NSM]|uniref:hypothetical protein n=1 Tax=Rhodopseudomonas sp. NSM TaxID=3457630 RepID=UPI004036378E
MTKSDGEDELKSVLRDAKAIAIRYYDLTEKPLGVTGEVAEYEAAEKLGLTLAAARTPCYDAYRDLTSGRVTFQIKGRAVSRHDPYKGRISKINCNGDFHAVLLVLLDKSSYETIEIWEAGKDAVVERLKRPGSRARNERSSLAISQFRSIAQRVWPAGD